MVISMNPNRKKILIKDQITKILVYTVGSIGVFILGMVIVYLLSTGLKLVKWSTIIGDSRTFSADVFLTEGPGNYMVDEDDLDEDTFYSAKWGIGIADSTNAAGYPIVIVTYVHKDSPLLAAFDKNNVDEAGNPLIIEVKNNASIEKISMNNFTLFAISRQGASVMRNQLELATTINEMTLQIVGGGIRGSIIATLYTIFFTLIIAVPLGVLTSIYFHEIGKFNYFTKILKRLVDLLTGVPSIIYGMLGAAVFVPLLNSTIQTKGGSVISGILTMSVIVLPTIIKSTEEALKVIPNEIREGSLALGSTQSQMIFKVVLPSAAPGILTGVLLGIGRIMGESAALIFAVGAAISDRVILTERATTLAVHIWVIMGGDAPNFELAAAIAIIILIVVFMINFLVKIFAHQLTRKFNGSNI
jgi:phosphate transport system permease protein